MSLTKVTFTPYPADLPVLEALTKNEPGTTIAVLVREIVGNYCAEKRMAKRLEMAPSHYKSRSMDDYSEVE